MPPPISSQRARWRGDASSSRGNQARGTVTVLPSERATLKESFVHEASTARTSTRSTEVFMPSPQEQFPIVYDDLSDRRQLMIPKSSHVCQSDRCEPELRVPPRVSHMNMWRLAALHAEEEEPIATNSEYRRHSASLPRRRERRGRGRGRAAWAGAHPRRRLRGGACLVRTLP